MWCSVGEDGYLLLAVVAWTGGGGGGGMLGDRGGDLAAGARPVGCERGGGGGE